MLIENFEEFFQRSKLLFLANPDQTRFTMKYRHSDKVFVLKVTDDQVCLSFKALYDTDMKRIERCYTLFFRLMSASSVENEKEMEIEEFKRTGRPADSTITQGRSKKQKRQQVKT